jgi:hypothetical protein
VIIAGIQKGAFGAPRSRRSLAGAERRFRKRAGYRGAAPVHLLGSDGRGETSDRRRTMRRLTMKHHTTRSHRATRARSAAAALLAAGMIVATAGSTVAWAADRQATDAQVDDAINHTFTQRNRADPFDGAYDWVQPQSHLRGTGLVSPQRDFQLQGRGLGE